MEILKEVTVPRKRLVWLVSETFTILAKQFFFMVTVPIIITARNVFNALNS